MKRRSLYAFIFLFSAGQAGAYTDAGGRLTFGPDGYSGVNAFAEWGGADYYFRPGLNTYKSDLAERVSAYSFGAGLDRGRWNFGGEVSVTPETGGYENTGVYADASYGLIETPAEDAALQYAALGAFAGLTLHEDLYAVSSAAVASGRRGSGSSTLVDPFKLTQADYGVTAAVKLAGMRASGRFAKTSYNKDITGEARQLPIEIGGVGASGFPDTAVSARLAFPGLPLSPSAGYTKTAYLLDQPDSESFSLGLSLEAGAAEISAGWESFNPGAGFPRSDYYSLGLTVSF